MHNGSFGFIQTYDYSDRLLTSTYRQESIKGTVLKEGSIPTDLSTTYYQYDSNGNVIGTVDQTQNYRLIDDNSVSEATNITVDQRSLINDAQGQVLDNILYASQTGANGTNMVNDSTGNPPIFKVS